MFAFVVACASADRYLFQAPMGFAPTQQFAGVQQFADAAMLPKYEGQMPRYAVAYPQAYAYEERSSTSWLWVAFCAAAGAALGTVARAARNAGRRRARSMSAIL